MLASPFALSLFVIASSSCVSPFCPPMSSLSISSEESIWLMGAHDDDDRSSAGEVNTEPCKKKKTVGDQKRDWPWQVRSPKPMQVEISTEYGANVWGKPQCIQHWEQVKKCCVAWVTEPRLYRYCIVWVTSISSRRVVQNDYTGEITVYYRQIFYVAP